MANIATLLARILSTRYGNEMRQDLHDAIEAVNDDTETALGKKLTFTTNTRKLKLLAKDDSVLSEVVIPGGGSGGGSVDSVNGLFPDENGNVEVNLNDINDVDITSAADGQTLVYDATSHKWVNGAGGGGTTDYTDLSNKPSVNGVTLSGNKTSADLGLQSELTFTSTPSANNKVVCQNDLPSGGGSNRNLLDNAWFTVNQKGTSGSITSGYGIDRWRVENGTFTINSDGTLTCGAISYQSQYANLGLVGKQVTFSVLLSDSSIKSVTFSSISANTYNNIYDAENNLTFAIDTRNSEQRSGSTERIVFFNNDDTNSVTIKALKLEIGSQSTLALDTAPNYTTELLKCQRYYYPLPRKWFANTAGINQYTQVIFLPLPTKMRVTPTLSGSLDLEGAYNGAHATETVATASIVIDSNDLQTIYATITSTNQYDRNGWVLVKPSSGAALSAEL